MADWRYSEDPDDWDFSPNNLSMDFGDDYDDEELADMQEVSPSAMAELTDRPTSTSNVSRPRTVAAGYDPTLNGGTLTVIFRDGTAWNYYKVTEGEWQNFHQSISKGRPWLDPRRGTIAQKPNGPADTTTLPVDIQAQVMRYRRIQLASGTNRKYRNGGKIAKFSRASNSRIKKFGKTIR